MGGDDREVVRVEGDEFQRLHGALLAVPGLSCDADRVVRKPMAQPRKAKPAASRRATTLQGRSQNDTQALRTMMPTDCWRNRFL